MKKILFIILSYFVASSAIANQPKDWQLGFQEAASSSMREIVNFHDKLLLPIIIEFFSPLYFKSCGGVPIEEKGYI